MIITICSCGHADTLHIVNPESNIRTPNGHGHCYDPECSCEAFVERVQLAQLISHRERADDIALLVGLDTKGRVWWWYEPDNEWQAWAGTFVFFPNVNTEKKP